MIIKMSLVTALYVVLTAALWLWVHGKYVRMTNGKRVLIGLIYGICAVLSTHFGVVYETMTLNLRDVAPLAAGLFFDPVSGIIAGLIGGVERYIAGTLGIGAYTKVACSLSTCLAGFFAALLNVKLFKGKKPSVFYAFFLGAVTEVFHMYVVFITHRDDMNMAFYVVETCAKPMIIFTGIGLGLSSLVLFAFGGRFRRAFVKRKQEEVPISVKFQIWLFICTAIMFAFTFVFSYSLQTRTSLQEVENIMTINTEDAHKSYAYLQHDYDDLQNLIKEQSLKTANAVTSAVDYFGGIHKMPVEGLESMCKTYDLYEIDLIDEDGIIVNSSNPLSVGYDLKSADQSRPFMDILAGKKSEFAQDFMPIGRDSSISLMYVGVKSSDGMIQIALDDDAIKKFGTVDDYEIMYGDRHVGEYGEIYVADKQGIILTGDLKGQGLNALGIDMGAHKQKISFFAAAILGVESYCRLEYTDDGYIFLTVMPNDEVYRSRNAAAYETAFTDILLFTAVFLLIYILVQKIIVNNLDRINESLAKITKGNLNEEVNVRTSSEFASLSDDINLTVEALKGYIEQAEKRIEEELEFAREIQHSALPRNFKFPRDEFDVYAMMDPAKEVGGDFYDFFFVDMNKMALVIADVSGKGIPAALFMMRSKTAIKSLAESGRSPEEIFEKANDVLCEGNDADMFVTAWIGIVDLRTGVMRCANAGHEYPVIKRGSGSWELYKDKHAPALGAMEGIPFKEYEIKLEPGDKLFVYTDGVPEAINAEEEQFGTDRMTEVLNSVKVTAQDRILPIVRQNISAFVGEAEQFDDITMLGFTLCKFTEKE